MAESAPAELVHSESRRRFETPDRHAYLEYRLTAGNPPVMELQHTYTAPSERGKGFAGQLAAAALDHARTRGYVVRPSCSYISVSDLARPLFTTL
eukprot:SM000243S08578  [mRNA]  locus=s243:83056:83340:+ [translate_table: standard]